MTSKYQPNKYPKKKKCPYCGFQFMDDGLNLHHCTASYRCGKDSLNKELKRVGKNHQGM